MTGIVRFVHDVGAGIGKASPLLRRSLQAMRLAAV